MNKHIQKMFYSPISNRLWFRLLRITIMRCKPNLWGIIQPKLMCNSLNNIIISVKLWPTWKQETHKCKLIQNYGSNLKPFYQFDLQSLTIPKKNHPPLVFPESESAQPTVGTTEKLQVNSVTVKHSYAFIVKQNRN